MLVVKLESPNDVQELERLRILENKLRNWIKSHKPQFQGGDDGLEKLAELVCDDLGYPEEDREDQAHGSRKLPSRHEGAIIKPSIYRSKT